VDPWLADDLRQVKDKTGQPLFEVAVRYAVTAPAGTPTDRVRGVADGVASAFGAHTGRNRLTRHRLRVRSAAEVLAGRRLARGFLLSVQELAALAHLPYDTDLPGLEAAAARRVAPLPRVPTAGKLLGDADAGTRRPVALSVADARAHVHVLGETGSGKSTLLAQLILADAAAGRGVLAVDPKGDLINDILDRLPTSALDRLVLIDPDDPNPPPVLNVLDGPDADLVADHAVGIMSRLFSAWWGPRTDDILRAAVLTLRDPANAHRSDLLTLAAVPKLLTEENTRRRATAKLHDPVLRGFWTWYEGLSPAAQAQAIGPVLNKLRAVLLRPFVRATLAAGSSTVDMAKILDGGICLVRLPKGSLGEDSSRLLGSFLLARVWQTVTHRARTGQAGRRDAAVLLDEAQNFLNLPHALDDMLAEARGYRLSLVLAHQHLSQLGAELQDGVSANARSKVLFTCSPEDARRLERHVAPRLSAHDLAHLDGYQAAARLLVDNRRTPAFTLRTRPLGPAEPGRAEQARAAAHRNIHPDPQPAAAGASGAHAGPTPAAGTRTRPAPARIPAARPAPARSTRRPRP
jgi:energy-coupling factor transporter ATP-binding protein EcfA2